MNLIRKVADRLACERGISLIAMATFISVTGVMMASGIRIYDVWEKYNASAATDEKLEYVQSALQRYFAQNGRYPCPARLDAPLDSADFGKELTTDCADTVAAIPAGTFRTMGVDGRTVRTGAVPVRTLNISDKYSYDAYRQRLVYAVTEDYAVQGQRVGDDSGDITVRDGTGNNATATEGNIVQLVYSMGWDMNGSYSMNGVQQRACDPAAASGENCDFNANATFRNTVNKSTRDDNLFVHNVSYVTNRHRITCEEANAGKVGARDIAFLLDTSGSMDWTEATGPGNDGFTVQCPASMPGCKRIDIAHWAMRRAIPAYIYKNSQEDEPGKTDVTGFVGRNNINQVENGLEDVPTFFHPDELEADADGNGTPDGDDIAGFIDTKLDDLEDDFGDMCPSGNTPLGLHIMGLANRLKQQALDDIAAGGDPDRPSKIIVMSDGLSNNGMDPMDAVAEIMSWRTETPPITIQVDIVDVVSDADGNGNTSLQQISSTTGGTYFHTTDPQVLLDSLYSSFNLCSPYTPPSITDQPACGGSWGQQTANNGNNGNNGNGGRGNNGNGRGNGRGRP